MKRLVRNKLKLKRIDLELLMRILHILSESNKGITSLQMSTRTNHSTCTRYVKFLERGGLVKSIINGKNKNVYITEEGRRFLKLLSTALNSE